MIVFANNETNNKNTGGYFITSGQGSMAWHGLPHDLARVMEDARQKGEEVKEMSIGLDGDWFIRTNMRRAWKTELGEADTPSNVVLCNQLTKRVAFGPYTIQSFTFMPDTTGFVAILHNADSSFTHCTWHNVPPKLAALLSREASKGISRVAVGVNGSYVMVLNNGYLWWSGVPESLSQLLSDAQRAGRRVATVSLSLISPSWYFVEFADGATKYALPQDWHAVINRLTTRAMGHSGPEILPPSNFTTLLPPHSPLDLQYEAFSPINAQNSQFECEPFERNPYPTPVLTPVPQTTTNFTHMYHVMPPQPQTASTTQNYDGTFWTTGEVTDVGSKVPNFTTGLGGY